MSDTPQKEAKASNLYLPDLSDSGGRTLLIKILSHYIGEPEQENGKLQTS